MSKLISTAFQQLKSKEFRTYLMRYWSLFLHKSFIILIFRIYFFFIQLVGGFRVPNNTYSNEAR